MLANNSNLNIPRRSERSMIVAMALVFLPWIAVILFTGGSWAALNFLGYSIVVFAAGYGIVFLALPSLTRTQSQIIMLSPAVGILAISALTAFWLRLRLPLVWVPGLWLVLALAGALCIWKDRAALTKNKIAYGYTLAILSLLICAIYFLPGAKRDAVMRHDGSYNWMYVDTQFFHSISGSIKTGDTPPKMPGTATAELLYHFAPYAPAAVISRSDGLNLGDAYARVTRGASLWALVLSAFGLGTLLSLKATAEKFGGILSVAGLFFYGALLSLFTDESNSASHLHGAILHKIRDISVFADGGPFSHLILGHSMLHGLGAITAVMGLCLALREHDEEKLSWRWLVLLALPALVLAVNSVAALYCVGIAIIFLFWGRLGTAQAWLLIAVTFGLFLVALKIMGYGHAPEAAGSTFKSQLAPEWWTLVVTFIVGLGFRIVGFRWISKPFKDPLSALVLASVVGLAGFSCLVHLDSDNERYGFYFLQCAFSLFAFSRLKPGFWRGSESLRWITEWFTVAKMGMILFVACGVFMGIYSAVTHNFSGVPYFKYKFAMAFVLLLFVIAIPALMKRSSWFSSVASVLLMAVLLIGFLGWIPAWLNFGIGRMKMDVTLTPGEVQGLTYLRDHSTPADRFATNRHSLDSLALYPERSYDYGALSERPVLLEGYLYHAGTALPWFQSLLHDNDLAFATTDPETVRKIAKTWDVRWLVARPGTDISLPKPLPSWLVEQQNSGDLKIYRVD